MRRGSVLLAAALLALAFGLSGCATSGGGPGAGVYTDCYSDYCVDYDGWKAQRLYLRTPAGPATGRRGSVTTSERRPGTQVVTRGPGAPVPAEPRMVPIPASRPSGPASSRGPQP